MLESIRKIYSEPRHRGQRLAGIIKFSQQQIERDRKEIIGPGIGTTYAAMVIERKHEQISLDTDHLLMVRRRKYFRMDANRQAAGAVWQRVFSHAAGNRRQRRILAQDLCGLSDEHGAHP
jgi:hypothetical protein